MDNTVKFHNKFLVRSRFPHTVLLYFGRGLFLNENFSVSANVEGGFLNKFKLKFFEHSDMKT